MVYVPYYGGTGGWVDGPGGHTPETAAALDTMEAGIIAAPTRWAPSTAYNLGEQVVSPNNDIVSAVAAHTSGGSYTAASWNLSTTYGQRLASVVQWLGRGCFNAVSSGDDVAVTGVGADFTGAVGDISQRGGIYTRISQSVQFHGGRNDPALTDSVARAPGNTNASQYSGRRITGGGDTGSGFVDQGSVSFDVVQGVLGPSVMKRMDILGVPTGGTFTLSYAGQTTSALAWNPTAADIQTALVGLSTIGTGNVTVTGSGAVFTVTLAASFAPCTEITAVSSLTGGTAPKVIVGTYAEMGGMLPQITNNRFGALIEAVEASVVNNVQSKASVVTALLTDNAGVAGIDSFNFSRGFWAHAAGASAAGDAVHIDSGANGWTNFFDVFNAAGVQVFRMDNAAKMFIGANARTLYDAGGGLTTDGLLVVGSFQTTGSMKTNGIVLGSNTNCLIGWSGASPNGVVTGSPGSIILSTAGGAATTLYVKESGVATNTGWVAK